MEIQSYNQGSVLYVARGDGKWSRSEFPYPQVTVDFDSCDRIIGVELMTAAGTGTKNPDREARAGLM